MSKKVAAALMVGGVSLVALAGAAAVAASGGVATSLPKVAISSEVKLAQASRPLPPTASERESEGSADRGSVIGSRKPSLPPIAENSVEPVDPLPTSYPSRNREIRIEAPNTEVRVNADTGRVRVDAPYAFVDVNPNRGRATVRAPGFSLDLRW